MGRTKEGQAPSGRGGRRPPAFSDWRRCSATTRGLSQIEPVEGGRAIVPSGDRSAATFAQSRIVPAEQDKRRAPPHLALGLLGRARATRQRNPSTQASPKARSTTRSSSPAPDDRRGPHSHLLSRGPGYRCVRTLLTPFCPGLFAWRYERSAEFHFLSAPAFAIVGAIRFGSPSCPLSAKRSPIRGGRPRLRLPLNCSSSAIAAPNLAAGRLSSIPHALHPPSRRCITTTITTPCPLERSITHAHPGTLSTDLTRRPFLACIAARFGSPPEAATPHLCQLHFF